MKWAGPKLDSKPISGAKWLLVSGFRSVEVAETFEVEIKRKDPAQLVWFWFSFNFAPRHFFKLEVEARLFTKGVKEDAILKR